MPNDASCTPLATLRERLRRTANKPGNPSNAVAPQVEPAACGGQLRGRLCRLEQTVRWGSPRCADWRGKPAHGTGFPMPHAPYPMTDE
jgi:hypothetical protein